MTRKSDAPTDEADGKQAEKETYRRPEVERLGTVAELTENNTGVGNDGGMFFVDDTRS